MSGKRIVYTLMWSYNKQIMYCVINTILYNYWYFVTVTCVELTDSWYFCCKHCMYWKLLPAFLFITNIRQCKCLIASVIRDHE